MMMEIWVDPATKRIMAIYDPGRYTGTVWQDLGYEKYDAIEDWMLPMEPPVIEPKLRMSLHEAQILSINTAMTKPLTARLHQEGDVFDVPCYVTQDLMDAHQAGKLAVGDWVLVYFIDKRVSKAIAQQKIFKTW